ncbi:S-adenosyl-L-methionine-dependent methyltransferase [Xylariaceae sp. FL1019]|nr:S-adenosyl-L-methionine-dependent methyltransferase [Xylariaceae sp. FL1019]
MVDTEELARGYTLVNNTQQNTGLYLLEKLNVQPEMRVLDVGCGPGNLTSHIADIVGAEGSVVGIDPSQERIAIARQEIKKPNTSFSEGRAEDLSMFTAGSFDIIFCNSTFHWVQDQRTALKEFARVLKPRGRLGMSGGSGDFTAIHERIKEDVLSQEPFKAYSEAAPPTFLKQRELERLLDEAGLHERNIAVRTIVKSAKNGDEMIDWLVTSSSGSTYGGIPLDLRPRAREEMRKEWDKVTTEDGIHMNMELLVTVAVKA